MEVDVWPHCPICQSEMHEPRLLDCLHPICTTCSIALTQGGNWRNQEGCPICDSPLPSPGSTLPPPHYPLQHRLIMNAVLSRRILCYCDSCTAQATFHCSTCLRNFCPDCGINHRQMRIGNIEKNHEVLPLWKAKRFRRTTVCLEHPEYPLRFFCIACQQVICSECLWRGSHRGHASEGHVDAAKSASKILGNTLRSARNLLDSLLLRYNARSFSYQHSRSSTQLYDSLTSLNISDHIPEWSDIFPRGWDRKEISMHAQEARERIDEFLRLRNARFLIDGISLTEQLLAEGSDAEILSLGGIILKRFEALGVYNRPKTSQKESYQHSGIFHCCTFCSSGGRKEVTCACQGKMPGGYKGCGHGHPGHPQAYHWSCCGSIDHQSICPKRRIASYRITL